MALPYPDSPNVKENTADSISRIEQNIEHLDDMITGWGKIINTTRDMETGSGDVIYSDVGFEPSGIMVFGSCETGMAIGLYPGIVDKCVYYLDSSGYYNSSDNFLVIGASTHYQTATVDSKNSDGFILTWVKSGSPTGTINLTFLCLR